MPRLQARTASRSTPPTCWASSRRPRRHGAGTSARCLRTLGRLEEALALQEALAAELDAAGVVDGYVTEERAECLLALGRDAEARPLFTRAHAELAADAWLADAEPERVARLARLGGL